MLLVSDDENQKSVSASGPEAGSLEGKETRVEFFAVSKRDNANELHRLHIRTFDHNKPETGIRQSCW